ncbi:MAG: multiprotein bridging factor aMBF1 [Promethearchaeota archaeon]
MSSKRVNDTEKECQICGGLIWGRGVKVIIEGAKITVCQNCAQHGKKIVKKAPSTPRRKVKQFRKTSNTKSLKSRFEPQRELEIIEDYTIKIRKIRQSLGLNQDQFAQKLNEKPSLLRRIETGKAKPSIKLAKKIEKVYGIKLITTSEIIDTSTQVSKYMKKSSGTSLGDMAFVKKKR